MIKNNDSFELENRYCQICGNFIGKDSILHRRNNKDIKKMESIEEWKNQQKLKKIRTYNDKLIEFETYYNSETYYDKDEGEEGDLNYD